MQYNRLIIILLYLLLAVPSCRGTAGLSDEVHGVGELRVHIDSTLRRAVTGGSPAGDGLLFIMEDGKVESVWQLSSSGGVFVCTPGVKHLWAIFNFGDAQREDLEAARTATDILEVGFPIECQGESGQTCFLTVGGNDSPVVLDAASTVEASLSGSFLCAKVTVGEIVNMMDGESAPSSDESRLLVENISLGPVSCFAYLDGSVSEDVYNPDVLWHDFTDYPLQLEVDASLERGDRCGPFQLYCYGCGGGDCKLDISVVTHSGSDCECECHYYVDLGAIEAGHQYLIDRITIYKEGNWTGDSSQSGTVAANVSCQQWTPGSGCDFDADSEDVPLQYSIVRPSGIGDRGRVEFDCYGKLRVSSSDDCVRVYGAGTYWELYGRKAGSAVITITNGFHTAFEDVSI